MGALWQGSAAASVSQKSTVYLENLTSGLAWELCGKVLRQPLCLRNTTYIVKVSPLGLHGSSVARFCGSLCVSEIERISLKSHLWACMGALWQGSAAASVSQK